ncbi:1-acyl-sn-glycerol-3-phosphate acyltransferase [Deinococcus sp. 6YEL10]|uniref:lysophospholipid acyltransferase family protein n=1 Tax=Deinococcus sp. 6YEL10 TaxID=2745870 RepID=UPI001E44FB7B|nr:lysophospholipid acyltransferase family protein [Deinococcus sp. 6YEL10]MCD0163038.1 1-acyl-sn-glycerol-3-phosphate acyltransferase [Deinococcus sp. 6YEL10]
MSDVARPELNGSRSPESGSPLRLAQPEPGPPPVIPAVYRFVVNVTYLPVLASGMHLEVHGREHVPAPGTPLVVAANHVSGLDPFLVARALPPGRFLQFMAKKELFVPLVGDVIRAGGSFPVDRSGNDLGAVRTSLRILKAGGTVGIFPQGTRGGGELHGGAALIAAKGRAPILPAGISREGKRWIVRFGEPISPRGGIKNVTAELGVALRELAVPVGRAY